MHAVTCILYLLLAMSPNHRVMRSVKNLQQRKLLEPSGLVQRPARRRGDEVDAPLLLLCLFHAPVEQHLSNPPSLLVRVDGDVIQIWGYIQSFVRDTSNKTHSGDV